MADSRQRVDDMEISGSKIELGRARRTVLSVWYVGVAVLIILYFLLLAGQGIMGSEVPFASPLGFEEAAEFLWLLHLCVLPVVLLRTPLVARALDLGTDPGELAVWRIRVAITFEVFALILILAVMVMARGNWPPLDYPTPVKLLIATAPLWLILLVVFLPFFPRAKPATPAELELVLRTILPEADQGSVPDLARWLAEVVRNAKHPERLQELLVNVSNLMGQLNSMAGQHVTAGSSLIDFGEKGTFGQVTIGDVVLGSRITINLNIAGPMARESIRN